MCDSVHRGGSAPNLGGVYFRGGYIFGGGISSGGGIVSGGYSFGGGVFFRGGLHRNTVNIRPVRILLECILVYIIFAQQCAG